MAPVHKFELLAAQRRIGDARLVRGQVITLPHGSPLVAGMKADTAWRHTLVNGHVGRPRNEAPKPIPKAANAVYTALKKRLEASRLECEALPEVDREAFVRVLRANLVHLLGDLVGLGLAELGEFAEHMIERITRGKRRRLIAVDTDGDGISDADELALQAAALEAGGELDGDDTDAPPATDGLVEASAPVIETAVKPATPAPKVKAAVKAEAASEDKAAAKAKDDAAKKAAKEAAEAADKAAAVSALRQALDDPKPVAMEKLVRLARTAKVGDQAALKAIKVRADLVAALRLLLEPPAPAVTPGATSGPPSPDDLG